ncbi:phosphoethanolamine transferase EptA [Marinomonas sp. RSW2]|uniref:Phosphoethanolamine transferase EptA n=1 Tax=Marinomonas maritima TaxID=2940935 RepID=A0ABT5WD56_9GAMM|nr:phosphoethanolamine transferase EptA [Marinomonas maritima]MDE8601546.1 phosphoethanolamine transferase EptA [Marinomonas maritima]
MLSSYKYVTQLFYLVANFIRTLFLAGLKLPTKITLSTSAFSFFLALTLVLFYNLSLWDNVLSLPYPFSLWNVGFYLSFFVFLVTVINILLVATAFRYLQKPLVILVLMLAAGASYFMDTYGIMIDRDMVQNTLETDMTEATELLSVKLIAYIVFLGIVPSIIVWQIKIKQNSLPRELVSRLINVVVSVLIISIIAAIFYQDYASFFRNNRYVRHLVNPVNFIYATASYTSRTLSAENIPLQAIALDAKKSTIASANGHPNLTVLVVGEAARAANFSLNGYERKTNPNLEKQNIVNFSNASSCGTATAVSVPCMFSQFERSDYSHAKSKEFEGLLDVLARVGVSVLWRENNSGCKGTCDRVPTDQLSNMKDEHLCNSKECFDEILLHKLDEKIEGLDKDVFIVLHQKGSHGPAYYQRYPQSFEQFTPVCETNQLQNCTQQEIINAYDNTLLYTDHFLNEVIEFLTRQSASYNTSMIYLSDHGESLGENNIYLHGAPYFIAPKEQTHIPFLMWFSDEYQAANQVDVSCLQAKSQQPVSQDYLFHSILGLSNITTNSYKEEFDVFNSCRKN